MMKIVSLNVKTPQLMYFNLRYLDLSICGNYGRLTPVTLRTFIYARGSKLTNLILSNCHIATKVVTELERSYRDS